MRLVGLSKDRKWIPLPNFQAMPIIVLPDIQEYAERMLCVEAVRENEDIPEEPPRVRHRLFRAWLKVYDSGKRVPGTIVYREE